MAAVRAATPAVRGSRRRCSTQRAPRSAASSWSIRRRRMGRPIHRSRRWRMAASWWRGRTTAGRAATPAASSSSIKAQLFDASGAKIGGEVLVNTATASLQDEPAITALADGGFVVAWEDNSGTGGDANSTSVKAQLFNQDGTKRGGEFLVN